MQQLLEPLHGFFSAYYMARLRAGHREHAASGSRSRGGSSTSSCGRCSSSRSRSRWSSTSPSRRRRPGSCRGSASPTPSASPATTAGRSRASASIPYAAMPSLHVGWSVLAATCDLPRDVADLAARPRRAASCADGARRDRDRQSLPRGLARRRRCRRARAARARACCCAWQRRRDGAPRAGGRRARAVPESARAAPAALRRAYPLPVEMLIVAAIIGVWQLARIPFEGSTRVSLAHAHDWLALERALHIDFEPTCLRFVHSRDWLLHGAQSFYRNLNEPAMIAFLAVARLLDPVRYPKLRTAYALLHVPGARGARALSRSRRRTGCTACRTPTARRCTRARSATRPPRRSACTSAARCCSPAGLLWLRPRAPLAWLTLLYPPVVFVVILGTGNHYVLDTIVGTACVGLGVLAAHAHPRPAAAQRGERRLGAHGARGNRLRPARVPRQRRLHRRAPMTYSTRLAGAPAAGERCGRHGGVVRDPLLIAHRAGNDAARAARCGGGRRRRDRGRPAPLARAGSSSAI